MRKIIYISLFTICVMLSGGLKAQTNDRLKDTYVVKNKSTLTATPANNNQNAGEVEISLPQYQPWDKVTMQGKFKMKGLPVSPGVKIFMQKDKEVNIALRVTLLGEVGRMILTPQSVTVVNKMNKTYVKEDIASFLKYYPGGFVDIQNLLLARFFLPGVDMANDNVEELVEVYYDNNQYNVVPVGAAVIEGIKYGFVVDSMFRPLILMVMPENRPDIQIAAFYKYNLQGYDIQFSMEDGNTTRDATLELEEPKYGGERPKDIDLSKYRKVSVNEFMRSFGR